MDGTAPIGDVKAFTALLWEMLEETRDEKARSFRELHAAYRNETQPAIHQYDAAMEEAHRAYNQKTHEAAAVKELATREAREKREAALSEHSEKFTALHMGIVKQAMDKTSDIDAEVAEVAMWMVRKGAWSSFPAECILFLENMPFASVGKLRLFGVDRGWCGHYDELLDEALSDGLLGTFQDSVSSRFERALERVTGCERGEGGPVWDLYEELLSTLRHKD